MKPRRYAHILFFIAAILFFVAGGLRLRSDDSIMMGAVFFVLGGAQVLLGTRSRRRAKLDEPETSL